MKKLIVLLLAAMTVFALTANVFAASAPVYGGKSVFLPADFKIDYDSVKGNGAFKGYRCTIDVVKDGGKDVVCVTAGNEANKALIDFSWYQYNNSEYLPALKTSDFKFLAIRYRRAAASKADFMFWTGPESELGKASASTPSITFRADATAYETKIIDLSKEAALKWTEKNLRQFRLYPWGNVNVNTYAGEKFYIEWFGFFKTEADAKAYGQPAATAAATTKAAATAAAAKTATAAKTADASVVIAAVLVSAAGAAVVLKNRKH